METSKYKKRYMHLNLPNSEYQYMVLHFLSMFFALEPNKRRNLQRKKRHQHNKKQKENKNIHTEKQKALTGFQADLSANPVITFQIGLTSTTRA